MFCEKCGNPVNDNDKFCQKCGAPVKPLNAAPQQAQPVQAPGLTQPEAQPAQAPELTQPEAQPAQAPEFTQPEAQPAQAPEFTQPEVQPAQAPGFAQPEAQPVQAPGFTQPVQPAEKKPLPKAAKLGIIFGGIGVAAVAAILVIVFAVIMPMTRTKIDLTRFVSVEFYDYGNNVVDGNISGEFELDKDKIVEAYPHLFDKASARAYLDNALYDIRVEYVDNSDSSHTDYGNKYVTFSSLKKDCEATVTITIPEKGSYYYEELKTEESKIGAGFEGGTVNIKLADAIEADNFTVVDPVEVDLLGYLEKNKLAAVIITDSGDITMGIMPFEEKFGQYTVKNESFESYAPSVYNENGDYVTSIYLEFDKKSNLKAGDKVKIKYNTDNSYLAENYGLVLSGKEYTYTAVMPEKLDESSAKKNAAAIKKYIETHPELDSSYSKGDKFEVTDLYYVSWNDNSNYHDLVAIVHNSTKSYFSALELEGKGFFADGEFIFGGYSVYSGDHGKSTDDAAKANTYLDPSSKYYKTVKLI